MSWKSVISAVRDTADRAQSAFSMKAVLGSVFAAIKAVVGFSIWFYLMVFVAGTVIGFSPLLGSLIFFLVTPIPVLLAGRSFIQDAGRARQGDSEVSER